ncbi:hypothetical protein Tco_0644724 [Tanacetum coccineum]
MYKRSRPFIYADAGILNMFERCGFSSVWRMRDVDEDLDEKNDKIDYKKLMIRCGWDRDVDGIELFWVATSSMKEKGDDECLDMAAVKNMSKVIITIKLSYIHRKGTPDES